MKTFDDHVNNLNVYDENTNCGFFYSGHITGCEWKIGSYLLPEKIVRVKGTKPIKIEDLELMSWEDFIKENPDYAE